MKAPQALIDERIERAKTLLKTARHAAIATVNADGSPHNTPVFLQTDEALKHIYWSSHPASHHSENIKRTGQLFVVLYDANIAGGLYIKAVNGHELAGRELEVALKLHNAARRRAGKIPIPLSYYENDGPQRTYGADVVRLWVNVSARDAQGLIIREWRHEITPADLL